MISPYYEDEEYPYNLTTFNEEDKEEEFNDMIEQLVKPKCVGILEDDGKSLSSYEIFDV